MKNFNLSIFKEYDVNIDCHLTGSADFLIKQTKKTYSRYQWRVFLNKNKTTRTFKDYSLQVFLTILMKEFDEIDLEDVFKEEEESYNIADLL